MRKVVKGCLIGCAAMAAIPAILLFLLLGACIVDAFIPRNPVKLAASLLETTLPNGTAPVTDNDTGPGLPIPGGASDGHSWLVLRVPAEEVTNFSRKLAAEPSWKPLPLSPELAAGENCLQPTIMSGLTGHIPLETAKGYYLFIDEQAEYNRKYPGRSGYDTKTPFYDRASLNFVFGVFDENTGLIYVWSIDT